MKSTSRALKRLSVCSSIVLGLFAASAQAAPVQINIVDVAGNLALTQQAFENFQKENPDLVSRMTFTKAPAPQIPGKIQAMQKANRVDIDLVLTGSDALAAGIEQGLWLKLLPDLQAQLPGVMENYTTNAAAMQGLANGQALLVATGNSGPMIEYNPAKVKDVPKTAEELLKWCEANPNKLIYARPANSGPGRAFMMGLPYLLGDKDPKDPINGWDKTWDYLKKLNNCVPYYPGGTGAVMKELGDGSRDMTPTTAGWDINPRALGIVPADFKVQPFTNTTWVDDAHYMAIPKGVSAEKQKVLIKLLNYMLEKKQQAMTYDAGYFYPGPTIKGVTLADAPAASQEILKKYGRAEYDKWLAEFPHVLPLDATAMVKAFQKWDAEIGALK